MSHNLSSITDQMTQNISRKRVLSELCGFSAIASPGAAFVPQGIQGGLIQPHPSLCPGRVKNVRHPVFLIGQTAEHIVSYCHMLRGISNKRGIAVPAQNASQMTDD